MSQKKARTDNQQRQKQFRTRVREARGSFLSVVLDKVATANLRRVCKLNGCTKREAFSIGLAAVAATSKSL